MTENGQKQINKQNKADITKLYDHADIANREMGEVKTDIKWLKDRFFALDLKVWGILITVIVDILIQIYFK
ncbi:MAG: hypothetical protein U9O94_04245 [Nanoarchaeota archaeon]|nr:hypothetical protein [Nanoarchaeota archaeon]